MKCKVLFLILSLLLASAPVKAAETPYHTLEVKASRFYEYGEWGSALAMYELMLRQKPDLPSNYYKSILLAGLLNDEAMQVDFMEQVQSHAIPFDSIFDGVKSGAVSLASPDVYVNFLSLVKKHQSWMARAIDVKLLEFAVFRGDADSTIALATDLLRLSPDNVEFLTALGNAYLLKGEYYNAILTMLKIVEYKPDDVQALLTIGNYYVMEVEKRLATADTSLESLPTSRKALLSLFENGKITDSDAKTIASDASTAVKYLAMAEKIQSTPYLRNKMNQVQQLLRLIADNN